MRRDARLIISMLPYAAAVGVYPRAKLIKFSDDMLRRIDDCRATFRPIPSESEVVRILIEEALTVRGFPQGS